MSYMVLQHSKNFNYIVLDTIDMVVERISHDKYDEAVNLGLILTPFREQTSNLGLAVKGNEYEVYFTDNSHPVYRGSFPKKNSRNELFDHIIKVSNLGIVDGNIVIVISCQVWCKYNIELPMIMYHALSIPIKMKDGKGNLGSCILSAYTSEPVLITDKSTALKQFNDCFGDYPTTCLVDKTSTVVKENKLKLLGLCYEKLPIYDDICKRLNFLQLSGSY